MFWIELIVIWYLVGLASVWLMTYLDWYRLGLDIDGGDVIRNTVLAVFGPLASFFCAALLWTDHVQPALGEFFRDFSRKTLIKGRKVRR